MFSHIFVGVSDFERALAFYGAVLESLGLEPRFCDRARGWAGWQAAGAGRPLFLIGAPFDRKPHEAGNGQMVAFVAESRARVERVFETALAHGATSEGAPGLRPQYHEHYFGAYFRDPDGNKLCVACHSSSDDWEARMADAWRAIDELEPGLFVERIDALTAELPAGSAIGLFERGAAQDSTGHPALAVPLYEAALATGLTGLRRRRATIQLASSLRNLGHPRRAAELLQAELLAASDELDGAVRAFLALALVDLGREREAVALSLGALSTYLPRYNRSLARYAEGIGTCR